MIRLVKKGIDFIKNYEIDLRIRMLFFLEYVAVFATVIGSLIMLLFAHSVFVLIPNVILFIFCVIGLYMSHRKKKYGLAAILVVVGADYFALPFMFFTSGGNASGMPIWFLFGLIITCLMVDGKYKPVMSLLSLLISCLCMLLGYYYPEMVTPLASDGAAFFDMLQSFVVVSIILCMTLIMHLGSYNRQKRMLEQKSNELIKTINTDALTGIANRHAFYEDSAAYIDSTVKEDLVLATMDINGLKTVNDREGHAAGDKLITSAATIISDAFSKYGKVYRTGGDEFVALLHCDDDEASRLNDILRAAALMYNEKNEAEVSIAVGTAVWKLNSDKNFFELEKLADANMYRDKNRYYVESGKDRRKR